MNIIRSAFALLSVSFLYCSSAAAQLPADPGDKTQPSVESVESARANVSADAMEQATALTERYSDTQTTRENGKVNVTFTDNTTGKTHAYTFDENDNIEPLERPNSSVSPNLRYKTEVKWWGIKYRLNRDETRQLVSDGNSAAILYAIGTRFGCAPCALASAIEANWSGQANTFYSRGNCIHLNMPYMTTGETGINTHNCRN